MKGIIRGSLCYLPGNFNREDYLKELDAEQAIGFDILWLSGYMFREDSLKNPQLLENLEFVYSEAEKRGMKVIAEVMGTGDWYMTWNYEKELELDTNIIDSMTANFGHFKSFYGLYLGYEIYTTEGISTSYCKDLFKALSCYCHAKKSDCVVSISPFFICDEHEVLGPYPYSKPEQYTEYWIELLKEAEIDVLMLQDSGEHVSFLSIEQRRPYFAAVKKACDANNVELWGNIELGEVDLKDFYELRDYRGGFGRQEADSKFQEDKWIAIEQTKLEQKIKLGFDYCTNLVSWGYQQFMSPFSDKPYAKGYYERYKKYVDKFNR